MVITAACSAVSTVSMVCFAFQLCLAIAAKAKTAACASTKNQRPYNPASAKYDLRVFLLRLGLIGPEFKNTRMHLMKRMPGSSAWKNGRPEGR